MHIKLDNICAGVEKFINYFFFLQNLDDFDLLCI